MRTLRRLKDVLIAIWLLGSLRRLERRLERGVPSSPRSSLSSTRTGLRPTSSVSTLDPDRTFHDAPCLLCRSREPVPLSKTRLERRPWRLVWTCVSCGDQATFPAPPDLIPEMRKLERPGGVAISLREARQFAAATAAEFDDALRDELLP